ncbi:unnamed protein product [Closterium sp. Naga37s-1]|nr:unnamed protein product [Closterium sp. Naga37s-1]
MRNTNRNCPLSPLPRFTHPLSAHPLLPLSRFCVVSNRSPSHSPLPIFSFPTHTVLPSVSLSSLSTGRLLTLDWLTLHWQAVTQSGDQLQLALEAKKGTPAAASWFAVGWSQSGKMGGSNVIVMEDVGSAPGEYDLESDPLYTAKAVDASWSASSSSVTESDKSVVLQ